jgi:hypothetical protein
MRTPHSHAVTAGLTCAMIAFGTSGAMAQDLVSFADSRRS